MKKSFFKTLALLMAMLLVLVFSGCGKPETTGDEPQEETTEETTEETEEEEVELPGAKYGYAGDDPVELAVYKYLVEEIGKDFEPSDASIPLVHVVHVDYTDESDILVKGNYWLFNYNIEGDTLKNVSGGAHPGCMHVKKDGDTYTVTAFDQVEDGAGNEESARKIFGDVYEDYAAYESDKDAQDQDRLYATMDYVNLNHLAVTKYQDEGWDPVELTP